MDKLHDYSKWSSSSSDERGLDNVVQDMDSTGDKELVAWLSQVWARSDVLDCLTGFMLASPDTSEKGKRRRQLAFKQMMNRFNSSEEMDDKVAAQIVNLFLVDLNNDTYPQSTLIDGCQSVLSMLESRQCSSVKVFEVLPKLLELLSYCSNSTETSTAMSYRNNVINSVCSAQWDARFVVALTMCFKEIDLSVAQLTLFLRKVCSCFSSIPLTELPSLVYHLYVLSKKGGRDAVVDAVIDFLHKQAESIKTECTTVSGKRRYSHLLAIQGTIILHTVNAMKQDQSLGTEFLQLVKSRPASRLNYLHFAILFSMTKIYHFESLSIDCVKQLLLKTFKRSEKARKRKWIRECMDSFETLIEQTVLSLAELSDLGGWDQVTEGMIKVCFALVDASVAGIFARKHMVSLEAPCASPIESVRNLAMNLIISTFQKQEIVRGEVVRQLFSRILSKAGDSVFPVLLNELWIQCPQGIIENIDQVRDALDYICFLPTDTVALVLNVVVPAICSDSALLNSLLLALKKGIFNRELNVRKNALTGYLNIYSTIQYSEKYKICVSVDDLLLEITSVMKRCLSQQVELKIQFYENLSSINESSDFSVFTCAFDILYSQFCKYIDDGSTVQFPFKFLECIKGNEISEPLANLVVSLGRLAGSIKRLNKEESNSKFEVFNSVMDSYSRRLSTCNLSQIDMSALNATGKLFASDLLRSLYEAFVEYQVELGVSNDGAEIISGLLDRLASEEQLSVEKLAKAKLDRQRIISLSASQKLLSICLSNQQRNQAFKEIIVKNDIAESVIVESVIEGLMRAQTLNSALDPVEFTSIRSIFKAVRGWIYRSSERSAPSNEELDSKWHKFIEILFHCLDLLEKRAPSKLMDTLRNTSASMSEENTNDLIMPFFFEVTALIKLSDEKESKSLLKPLSHLLHHLANVIENYPICESDAKQMCQGVIEICREFKTDDVSFVKNLMLVLVALQNHIASWKPINFMIEDCKNVLGTYDVKENDPSQKAAALRICSPKTANTIMHVVITCISQYLEDFEWIQTQSNSTEDADEEDNHHDTDYVVKIESSLMKHMHEIVNVMILIESVCISEHIEGIFNCLIKIYRILAKTLKAKTTDRNNIHRQLVDVIASVSTQLTPGVYGFISFTQAQDIERAKQAGPVRKKKGKNKVDSNSTKPVKTDKKNKLIPNLVYEIEQYENWLIRLSKKANINLTKYCKRSTTRDFKITVEELPDDNPPSDDDENEEENLKKPKKIKC